MIALLCAFAISHVDHPLRMLFLGNSHTYVNDVPGLVKSLLESDGTGRRVETQLLTGGHLNDMDTEATRSVIRGGHWDIVVMQGAMVSMSMSRHYSQAGGIDLARVAKASGARVLMYVEWPRRGIDEAKFTYDEYKVVANACGGEMVPVCYAWAPALRLRPDLDLWAGDGNHSSPTGAYLAACTFYYYLTSGSNPRWVAPGLDRGLATMLEKVAKETVAENRKREGEKK